MTRVWGDRLRGASMKRPTIGLNTAYILPCVLAILVISALGFTAGQLVGSDPNGASGTSVSTYTYKVTSNGTVVHLKGKVTRIHVPASTKVINGQTITIPASTSIITSPGQTIHTTRVIHSPGGVTTITHTQTDTTTAVSTTTATTTFTTTQTIPTTISVTTTVTVPTTVTAPPST